MGKGNPVRARFQPSLLGALDKFIADEKDERSSRPHAVRIIFLTTGLRRIAT